MKETILAACRALCGDCAETVCENGAVLLRTAAEDASRYGAVSEGVAALGFAVHDAHEEAGNLFADLYRADADMQVHLSYDPVGNELRLLLTEGEALPPIEGGEPRKLVTPQVTQIQLCYCMADCGMSYVIRLCDGRFIVLDGGYAEYEETERLLSVLESQNTVYPKPRIAAWFISHAHSDHFGCFVQMMERYRDRVELELVAYNWATEEMCPNLCDHGDVDRVVAGLLSQDCRRWTPHTGQRMQVGDAVFDVLFACEDLLPQGNRGFNNTSLVMRMEQNGRRILWLADAEPPACERICNRFPASSLRCELLQVGHHGYAGGSPELYRRADPEILLWPCPDFWYHIVREWPSNDVLRTSPNVRGVFVGGRYTTEIDMTAPVPEVPPAPMYDAGDVIAAWNMQDIHRVIDLNWSCISGGQTGYWSPYLYFSEDGACVMHASDREGVVELLRPELLEHAPAYEMVLEGEVGECAEQIGILCNDATPTVPSREQMLSFVPQAGHSLCMRLQVSESAAEMCLEVDGEEVAVLPYIPARRHGLYLYLKHTLLRVKTVLVVRR